MINKSTNPIIRIANKLMGSLSEKNRSLFLGSIPWAALTAIILIAILAVYFIILLSSNHP